MGLMCWLKSSCSSSCRYPVISLFSFPPRVHTQGSQVSAAFREASSHGLIVARIWVFSDDENRPFQFSPGFHSQQIPKVAYYQTYSSARRGGTSACDLPIVFMSMHMSSLCMIPISIPMHMSSLCMTPISIPMQACRHLIPMFFPLSTTPIVHLSTSLSKSSYPFPHSSLQESSILHHTHFPLIHSLSHSLTYMESRGCMLSFTPSHTH